MQNHNNSYLIVAATVRENLTLISCYTIVPSQYSCWQIGSNPRLFYFYLANDFKEKFGTIFGFWIFDSGFFQNYYYLSQVSQGNFHTSIFKFSIHSRASVVTLCMSSKLPVNRWMGQFWCMCTIVCTSTHSHIAESLNFHLCKRYAQHPWPVRNRLTIRQVLRCISVPFSSIVGSVTNCWFWTVASSHHCFHLLFRSAALLALLAVEHLKWSDFNRRSVGAPIISAVHRCSRFSDIPSWQLLLALDGTVLCCSLRTAMESELSLIHVYCSFAIRLLLRVKQHQTKTKISAKLVSFYYSHKIKRVVKSA